MYITRVAIENIRSIKHLIWEIDADHAPGWHVILGDNGSGKSTFVRAVALSLLDSSEWAALRIRPNSVLRFQTENASCKVHIANNLHFGDKSKKNGTQEWLARICGFSATHKNTIEFETPGAPKWFLDGRGWLCASFGPFRRFGTANEEFSDLQKSYPRAAPHASLFIERTTFHSGLKWLEELQFQALENNEGSKRLLEAVILFINQPGFLPNGASVSDVSSAGVSVIDQNGFSVPVQMLSDGFGSVLSLTFELLRLLSNTYDSGIFEYCADGSILVKVPAVIQIDEIDIHLHPTWQRTIGFWLTKHFPKIQFIVTTHSPLVCQAAEKGSIFKLPTPGTEEVGHMLTGSDRDRLLYGDILDAYSTEAFGYGVTRSKKSQDMLERLSDLNLKEMMDGLGNEETIEQERLRAMLPTTASALPAGSHL